MTISIGDRIPNVTVKTNGPNGPVDISTEEIFSGKRVVLFAVPGAFTPGCSMTHLPGFVENADKILAKGVDRIACMAVNDAFVMDAWQKQHQADNILMLADGNGDFTRALGMELDASGFGMGNRCKRFAMIVEDGVVKHLGVDERAVQESSAETILSKL